MKTFRGTFILLILAVIGIIVAVQTHRSEQAEKERKQKEGLLYPGVQYSDLQKVVVNGREATFQLQRKSGRWHLVEPFKELASESKVKSYITDVLERKVDKLDLTQEKIDPKEYSLGEKAYEIKLSGDKESLIRVSHEAAFDGSHYIQKGVDGPIFIGGKNWARLLEKLPEDFRERKLLPTPLAVNEMTYKSSKTGNKKLHFKKEDGSWNLVGSQNIKIAGFQLDAFIRNLKNARAQSFESHDQKPQTLRKYHLHRPQGEIAFNQGQWRFYFSQKGGEVYGYVNNRPAVFKLAKAEIKKWQKGLTYFRDKKYPFEFKKADIKKVQYNINGEKVDLIKEDQIWTASKTPENFQFDPSQVTYLISQVSGLRVEKFSVDKNYGSLDQSLILQNSDGETLLGIKWKNIKNQNVVSVPMHSSLTDNTYLVEKYRINNIEDVRLFKPKNKKKGNSLGKKADEKANAS